MVGPQKKPTKAEQDRIDRLRPLGCSACAELGIPNVNRLELHHIVQGNKRLGHWYSIFLCVQHHRSIFWEELWGVIPFHLQVGIADGKKAFYEAYGGEKYLWEKAQARLHLPGDWPGSKVMARRV